jgi:hypothetical protein
MLFLSFQGYVGRINAKDDFQFKKLIFGASSFSLLLYLNH